MKLKIRDVCLIIINALIFISTVYITCLGVLEGAGDGQLGDSIAGIRYFIPYTVDSNILLGICSFILIVGLIIKILKEDKINPILFKIYYVGTVSIIVTLMTVILFLAPMAATKNGLKGALSFFSNDMFFFHLLNPLLAIVSFVLLRSEFKLNYKDNLLALIPMGVYSLVYFFNVIVFKTWSDFYGFTFGGKIFLIPFVIIIMFAFTYLFGFILRKIQNL